ncbi:27303_t:CDS:2, partial [Dentiscutata erythropus]
VLELFVGKTFENWDQVEKFMKKYAAIKGHGVWIGGGGRINTATHQILKRSYLCRHAGKPPKNMQPNGTSCRVGCPWKVNIWTKKDKNCLEVTTMNDQHVGHELQPLASRFDPTLRKLSKEIVEEIRFLTVVAKADATMQYRIIPFTNDYFTAGVQSTFRNEGENSTLKRLFGASNLSLCELFDVLKERYQEENDYCEFINWKQTTPQIGPKNIAKSIFEPIVQQLNEFVMPNIMKKQEEQMNLSLHYHAIEIDFKIALSDEKKVNESDQCIDNLFDCPQVHLSSFLNDFSKVLEVWKVLSLTNTGISHFVYCLDDDSILAWRINVIQQGANLSNNEFIVVSLDALASTSKTHPLPTQFYESDINRFEESTVLGQSHDEISKAISKKHKFGELWGLGKKIMVDAIEDNNDDIYHELLRFFSSIKKRMIKSSDIDNNFNYSIGDCDDVIVQNPIDKRPKGRPKSDSKRIKSAIEKTTQYRCRTCKQKGHNSKTCKGKRPSDFSVSQDDETESKLSEDNDDEESSTSDTSHEDEDTIESGLNDVIVLVSPPIQQTDFKNHRNTQRQCSICCHKGHNARTCPNKGS